MNTNRDGVTRKSLNFFAFLLIAKKKKYEINIAILKFHKSF